MEFQKCLLCGERDATKTNSHLIPSFLVAQVCSYDGSGNRDKEVMFTMTPYEEKVYTGQIPDTKYEELFDMEALSEERIERELKENTASKDYIFCPMCEKRLSDILETPYAKYHKQGGNIAPEIAFMFWMSIVWRMSVSEQFAFRIPNDIEQRLGRDLNSFMAVLSEGGDVTQIVSNCPFRYRIVKSDGKNANAPGYLGGHYNYDYNILTYTIGDMIVCAQFGDGILPEGYEYYGFENALQTAPLNNGSHPEEYLLLKGEEYDRLIHTFVIQTAHKRFEAEKELVQACWNAVGLEGVMPPDIMRSFIERLYSDEVKQGDRHSRERYVELFNAVLQSFGYKPR